MVFVRPAVALLGLLTASTFAQSDTTFTSLFDGTPSQPTTVALGDYDGDGSLDLAIADGISDTIILRLGDGDGTFSPGTFLSTVASALSVAFGDLDGDGNLDVVCGDSSGRLNTFLGDGAGVFTTLPPVFVSSGGVSPDPIDTVLADINGDGVLDVVTANAFANSVSVLRGLGTGGFGAPLSVGLPGVLLRSVTVADFDGDGAQEIVAGGLGTPYRLIDIVGASLVPLPNTGVVGFQARAADLDGDGDSDLAIAGGVSDSARVLLNDGSGVFGAVADYPAGWEPACIVPLDIDGDGDTDLALGGSATERTTVLVNDGSGAFAMKGAFRTGLTSLSITSGDVDNDGTPDVVVTNLDSAGVSVLRNEGAGPWTALGSELPQDDGLIAQLTGIGPLVPGSFNSLDLAFARTATFTALIIGFTAVNAPFKGGVLVPTPDVIVPGIPVGGDGGLAQLDFLWPAGIPAGSTFWFQHWFSDARLPQGFASSNGLSGEAQ